MTRRKGGKWNVSLGIIGGRRLRARALPGDPLQVYEDATTALPADQLHYKPHEKNTSAGDLANAF